VPGGEPRVDALAVPAVRMASSVVPWWRICATPRRLGVNPI